MRYSVLKPHIQDGIDYDKGDMRENLDNAMITHLMRRGVIEEERLEEVKAKPKKKKSNKGNQG